MNRIIQSVIPAIAIIAIAIIIITTNVTIAQQQHIIRELTHIINTQSMHLSRKQRDEQVAFTSVITVLQYMAYIESSINPEAVSSTDDVGLYQINSRYIDYFIQKYWHLPIEYEPHNATHSKLLATYIYADLYYQYGTYAAALGVYNTGPGGIGTAAYHRYIDKYKKAIHSVHTKREIQKYDIDQ